MYLDYWSLERPPFEAQPDSRFFYATPQHEQALAALSYAACEGGEPVLLTGRPGCGKTLLLRGLRRQLPPERYRVAFVPDLACSRIGLLTRVAYHLTHSPVPDTATAVDTIPRVAADAEQNGQNLVLMLDDWPANADGAAFDELHWLLNLDTERSRVCVLLAGEDTRPAENWPRGLVQRLFAVLEVAPLTPDQVPQYLEHRLRVAGRPEAETFEPQAAQLIADWSQAVPRLINRAAHLALHVAYVDLAKRVTADAVRRALDRLTPTAGPVPNAHGALLETTGAQP